MEQFRSKKNLVFRIKGNESDFVRKTFTDPGRFQTEKEIGDVLQGSELTTPGRLRVDERGLTLYYEHIDALPAIDFIESKSTSDAKEIIEKICEWLILFHTITKEKTGKPYIWGDAHLRNFIFEEVTGTIYGVDFEECRLGSPESDVARLYVFLLNYDPPFTERKKLLAEHLVKYLTNKLKLDKEFLEKEIKREGRELIERRKSIEEKNYENFK